MELDCLFISDSMSEYHLEWLIKSIGKSNCIDYNKPLLLKYYNYSKCCLISINSLPQEFLNKVGIIKARKQFLNAVKYSVENLQSEIILLAASTKRLFGKNLEERVDSNGILSINGNTLNEFYPNVLFTNGDNGTSIILDMEIESNLSKINKDNPKPYFVINGLGLLGMSSLEYLLSSHINDEQIIVISNYTKDLKEVINGREIKLFQNILQIDKEIGNKIELIINCTHNPTNIIDLKAINHIQNGQQIYVIDVAVPYGFPEEEYLKCKNVIRQDGGNAYIEKGLEFFFNPELCGLTENVLYGCFAETIALSAYLKENPNEFLNIRDYDFFNVNKKTKKFVKDLFDKYGIGIAPKPYNFMKRNDELDN